MLKHLIQPKKTAQEKTHMYTYIHLPISHKNDNNKKPTINIYSKGYSKHQTNYHQKEKEAK